jgi:hypothetical protein
VDPVKIRFSFSREGRTNPEIARHLDCSPSAVERKLRLIREQIEAELLPDAGGEPIE